MKVIIFGTGKYYQKYKIWFTSNSIEIIGLIDNNIHKHGTILDGIEIFSPGIVKTKNFDLIYILSIYKKEMRKQLLQLGVHNDKIHDDFDLQKDFYKGYEITNLVIYGHAEQIKKIFMNKQNKRILLVTYDFNLNGAGIVFLYLTQVLHKLGYNITIVGMFDGSLKYEFLKMNITVIIDLNLQIALLKDIKWISKFSLIWVNTIWFYQLLKKHNYNIPTVWWLHDSQMMYKNINTKLLSKINKKNLFIYAVSDIADIAFRKYVPGANIKLLPFGIPDFYNGIKLNMDKIIFAVVGGICKRKAQDIFIKSLIQLRKEYSNSVEFWIVGNSDSEFAKKILEQVQNIDDVKILGEVNRKQIEDIYKKISVLVCPSREETVSVVTIEAMMNCIPCIVSTGVGMAKFITDGEDGFKIPVEDSQALYKKMKWFVEHKADIEKMGANARTVYLDNFSMEGFKNNIIQVINNVLKKK